MQTIRSRCLGLISCMIVLMSVAFAAEPGRQSTSTEPAFRVVGYLPDYRLNDIDHEVGRSLTDVVFFSVKADASGQFDSPMLSSPRSRELMQKFQDRGVNVLVCVGGWDRSAGFPQIAATTESRQAFAQRLSDYCRKQGFAGADLDWEHPKDDTEAQHYGLLLAEISKVFGPQKLRLTAAVAGWQSLTKQAIDALDTVHLMAYDADGKHATMEIARKDVRRLLDAGVPAKKICLGLPFYGRGIKERSRVKTYAEIVTNRPLPPERDELDGLYFNGPSTIRAKINFAREQQLGGVMIWELGQDAPGEQSLLKVITETIR